MQLINEATQSYLDAHDIRGLLLHWMNAFVKSRTQYVKIDNASSDNKPIDSGVIQGSLIVPLIFTNYFHHISESVTHDEKVILISKPTGGIFNVSDLVKIWVHELS